MSLQTIIDALSYPPTHTYVLGDREHPTATGVLAERLQIMRRLTPEFWQSTPGTMLDVGCNKGFFSLLGKQAFEQVVGIDPVSGYVDLCREICPSGEFVATSFRDYVPAQLFDRVLIANGHHHLFKESSWAWVRKLAAITRHNALVLIEGIPNESAPDGAEFPGLREEDFLCAMKQHFDLLAQGPSCGYTPGRQIWLFKRHFADLHRTVNYTNLSFKTVAREGRIRGSWHQAQIAFSDTHVYKTYAHPTDPSLWIRAAIASLMPGATGITSWIIRDGQVVGWSELRAEGSPGIVGWTTINNFDEATRYAQQCHADLSRYERELILVGYFDADPSLTNIVGGKIVDKNNVLPISQLGPKQYDFIHGTTATVMRGRGADENDILRLCSVMATRDAGKLLEEWKRW